MKSTALRVATLALLGASTLTAQGVVGRDQTVWTVTQSLSSGERFHVSSPNGEITISQGTGSSIQIRAEKNAERGGAIDEVGFIVRQTDGGLAICAVYENDDECELDRGYRPSERGSNGNWKRRRVRTSFTVTIPVGVSVQATTGNGDVSINGAGSAVRAVSGNGRILVSRTTGTVTASTGNGKIDIDEARGAVEATTGNGDVRVVTSRGPVNVSSGNGDITVSMAQVERAADMRFATGNGRIVVGVPESFGAEMVGTTGNGNISTEIPMRVQGRITPHRMQGTLGNGGERFELTTGNGDIVIQRAR